LKLKGLLSSIWLALVVTVAVAAKANQPPVLDPIGPKSTTEGKRLTFEVSAWDPDGTVPVLYTWPPPLPGGASFANHLDGTGTFDWTPDTTQAGTYYIGFFADDGEFIDSEVVTVTVVDLDPGIRDTLQLLLITQSDSANDQLNVTIELYCFHDEVWLTGVTVPILWDNPNLQMDSARASAVCSTAFDGGICFYNSSGDIDSTNISRNFQFGAYKVSTQGLAPVLMREHWATWYFTLSNWSATDSVAIWGVLGDSTGIPAVPLWFSAVTDTSGTGSSINYVPLWKDTLVIKDVSDVRVVDGAKLPETFSLSQNYPNPFNPTTQINFEIPFRSHVSLTVYNVLGQKVTTLVDKEMSAGSYIADWNGASDGGTIVASGVYFYKLEAGDFIETKKMVLLK
jgi:hypothetical protein